jgi:diaminopimelate decarboxylase
MKPQPLQYVGDDLCFEGRAAPIAQLLGNYHRPTYIYDFKVIEKRLAAFKKALPPTRIHYAMKANTSLKVLKFFKSLGTHVDVVSAGEIKQALKAGFEPSDVIFSGVGKTKMEIRFAIEAGIYQFNAESLPEIERIGKIAENMGQKARVSLRLNPNIEIGTHPYIATGLRENKFGLELEALPEAMTILRKFKNSIEPVGISFHLGSQMTEPSSLRKAFQNLMPLFSEFRCHFATVQRLDFGGGLGIHYQEKLGSEDMILKTYAEIITEESKAFQAELQCEPGRWLVAHAGIYIAQVQYVKKTSHKNFLILDGGMNHLIRPSLYGAYHEIYPLKLEKTRPHVTYDVVGPICESSDFLAKDRSLQEMKADELVAIADAGAYGAVMASTYNLHDLPLEITLD